MASTPLTTSWECAEDGSVPSFAVLAGFDKVANCNIYVCRVHVDDQLVPGKVVPNHKCAYITINGKEETVTKYEVLTDPNNLLKWQKAGKNDGIPWGAIAGGYDNNRMTTYVARGFVSIHDENQSCGKYIPQTKKCLLPWDGKEVESSCFSFLVEIV